jgi:GNAT superfamily N-acetyltransferase
VRAIRAAAAADLTSRFGSGHWSLVVSVASVRERAKAGGVYLIEVAAAPVATFFLSDRKIGFYNAEWFADPAAEAGYLRDLAVHPDRQRQGIGRYALAETEALCRAAGLRAVRFDAYQGEAGAGPFYVKCGCTLRHSGEFRGVELDYFEKVLVL